MSSIKLPRYVRMAAFWSGFYHSCEGIFANRKGSMAFIWIYVLWLSSISEGVVGACNGGREYGGICYKYRRSRLTWRDAYDACYDDGGTLPVISDSSVEAHLQAFMEEEGLSEAWLGAREQSLTPNTQWYWIHGTEAYGTLFSSIGCFGSLSEFTFLYDNKEELTPQICIEDCDQRGYLYAAVKNRDKCFCGNSYQEAEVMSSCSNNCPGDATQTCGGFNDRANVFLISGSYGVWLYNNPTIKHGFKCAAFYMVLRGSYVTDLQCNQTRPAFACVSGRNSRKCSQSGGFLNFMVDGSCVVTYFEQVTWFEARHRCISYDSELLWIPDASFHRELTEKYEEAELTQEFIWVALARTDWVWKNSNEGVIYTRWVAGDPKSGRDRLGCASVSSAEGYNWKDDDCTANRRVICTYSDELEVAPLPPTTISPASSSTVEGGSSSVASPPSTEFAPDSILTPSTTPGDASTTTKSDLSTAFDPDSVRTPSAPGDVSAPSTGDPTSSTVDGGSSASSIPSTEFQPDFLTPLPDDGSTSNPSTSERFTTPNPPSTRDSGQGSSTVPGSSDSSSSSDGDDGQFVTPGIGVTIDGEPSVNTAGGPDALLIGIVILVLAIAAVIVIATVVGVCRKASKEREPLASKPKRLEDEEPTIDYTTINSSLKPSAFTTWPNNPPTIRLSPDSIEEV